MRVSVKLLSCKREMGKEGGGCHANPAAIHSKLDCASQRWDSLQKLAKDRRVYTYMHTKENHYHDIVYV